MQKTIKKETYINCKDHTVSGEEFQLIHDQELDMLITRPKPARDILYTYYESPDYISHTDAKRSLFEKLYHLVKNYSLNKKMTLLSKFKVQEKKILDIGAGTGDFLVAANKKGWSVFGSEPNKQARLMAREKQVMLAPDTNEFDAHSFDVISMWHVLEHVYDVPAQIEELKRLLKPDGHLIIAVPNFKSYDAKYYKSFWAAFDVPRHLSHFSKKSVEMLFRNKNILLEEVVPMKFDSYYVSLLSEKYKTGKMNFCSAMLTGFRSNFKAKHSKEYSSHIYILKNR